jgi:hypothetical protein
MTKELYEFRIGTEILRYTSSEREVTYNGNAYIPQAIKRGDFKKDYSADSASITLPQHLQPAPRFRIINPSAVVIANIIRVDGIPLFRGKVSSCAFDMKKGTATLKLISVQAMLKTAIPKRTYSAACTFEIFDEGCALNKNTYGINIVAPAANDNRTEFSSPFISAKADGYFAGGYAQVDYEYSYILSHAGDTVKLLFPLQLYTGVERVYFYPGCDKARLTCKNKFNNEKNYGGFPFIPVKNPMEGF